MGAKLHICCGIKEEKPNYFAHDFAQSQKIRADLQALPYKNVIIYHFFCGIICLSDRKDVLLHSILKARKEINKREISGF
ncbi:hypothetical protein [Segatella copri]|nr:hypothetical protein [Segatella copri]